jgi:hypothetical protein
MRRGRLAVALVAALALLASGAVVASAAPAPAPAWRLDAISNTTAAPGALHTFYVQLTNTGGALASGAADPIVVGGTLPAGMTVVGSSGSDPQSGWDCSGVVPGAQAFACEDASGAVGASGFRVLTFQARIDAAAAAGTVLTASFTASGGGAAAVGTVDAVTLASSPPGFGVAAFDGTVMGDPSGTPYTQAGGHPYAASVSIDFDTLNDPAPLRGDLWPVEPVKDVLADLPPGLVGNPTGTEQCTAAQLANGNRVLAKTLCPAASQVGTALVRLNGDTARDVFGPLPVYDMVPPPDVPARFGFNVAGTIVTFDGELRSGGDYGLSVRVRDVPQGLAIAGTTLTFWGVPADLVHDPERACPGQSAPWAGGPSCSNGGASKAFLRNPTACGPSPDVGLPVGVSVDSWAHPGVFRRATFTSHLPPGYPFPPSDWGPQRGVTGCDAVPFDPGLVVAPDSAAAGAPSGYAFTLTLPQSDDPARVGESDLRRAVVRLPAGVRVNPSAADGLEGCSAAQVALSSSADAACPDGSRVGSVTVVTPLLPSALEGQVYLAAPGMNPFGSLLAVYVVARGPGLIVKLAGQVESDPLSGQLTATFDDVPQLPFSSVRIAFDGGPRAVLVNPPACGRFEAAAELTGWSGAERSVTGGFDVDSGCFAAGARPFTPGFSAGVESNGAGRSSPFHLGLTRSDADEELGGLTVRLPRGLLGRLSDVVLCGAGDAAAGTCPSDSLIGSVIAGAGAGPLPFYIGGGRVYVTGPYRGAPLGLSIAVPAVAGPFDLGVVVVRAAVFVDRTTAALRVVTDPLPTILQGIPLQLRDVRVAVDRPGFMVNPTSCAEKHVRGVVASVSERVVGVSARFEAAECRELPFHPRLRLFVGARGHTHARQSTPLTAVLTQAPGEAGIRFLRVTLPSILSAQLPVIRDACTPAEFDAGDCEKARIGTAVAVTPLLRDPLRGGAYLVRPAGQPLPNLVIGLRGLVAVDLVGRVSIPGGSRLSATFRGVPDVPIRRFVLRLAAGPRGIVGLAGPLCRARRQQRVAVKVMGQAGAAGGRSVLGFRGCR